MNKKLIRLTEQDLHRIVKESARNILKEWGESQDPNQDALENSIERVRSIYNDVMQSLTELAQACEEIPNEGIKMHLRPPVTVALNKLKGLFPLN